MAAEHDPRRGVDRPKRGERVSSQTVSLDAMSRTIVGPSFQDGQDPRRYGMQPLQLPVLSPARIEEPASIKQWPAMVLSREEPVTSLSAGDVVALRGKLQSDAEGSMSLEVPNFYGEPSAVFQVGRLSTQRRRDVQRLINREAAFVLQVKEELPAEVGEDEKVHRRFDADAVPVMIPVPEPPAALLPDVGRYVGDINNAIGPSRATSFEQVRESFARIRSETTNAFVRHELVVLSHRYLPQEALPYHTDTNPGAVNVIDEFYYREGDSHYGTHFEAKTPGEALEFLGKVVLRRETGPETVAEMAPPLPAVIALLQEKFPDNITHQILALAIKDSIVRLRREDTNPEIEITMIKDALHGLSQMQLSESAGTIIDVAHTMRTNPPRAITATEYDEVQRACVLSLYDSITTYPNNAKAIVRSRSDQPGTDGLRIALLREWQESLPADSIEARRLESLILAARVGNAVKDDQT